MQHGIFYFNKCYSYNLHKYRIIMYLNTKLIDELTSSLSVCLLNVCIILALGGGGLLGVEDQTVELCEFCVAGGTSHPVVAEGVAPAGNTYSIIHYIITTLICLLLTTNTISSMLWRLRNFIRLAQIPAGGRLIGRVSQTLVPHALASCFIRWLLFSFAST